MKNRRNRFVLFAAVIASCMSVCAHADRGNNCSADIWPGTDPSDCSPAGFPMPGVNLFDLLALIDNWGLPGPAAAIAEPLDTTDLFDLLALIDQWGDCAGVPCQLPDGCYVAEGWTGDVDCNLNCECINGEFICDTDLTCNGPCLVNGKPFNHGSSNIPLDACNVCDCFHGELTCTDLTCFAPCLFNGKPVAHGGSISGPCEVCTCEHGVLDCDYSGCNCEYKGVPIMDGETVPFGCELATCDQGTLIIDDSGCP